MQCYDLDLGAWVRKPGSTAPPWTVPVFAIGGVSTFAARFLSGGSIVDPGATAWLAGVKLAGDMTGPLLASDAAPVTDGDGLITFSLDMSAPEANAYFLAHTTEDHVRAVIQISYTADGIDRMLVPLECFVEASYLTAP